MPQEINFHACKFKTNQARGKHMDTAHIPITQYDFLKVQKITFWQRRN